MASKNTVSAKSLYRDTKKEKIQKKVKIATSNWIAVAYNGFKIDLG